MYAWTTPYSVLHCSIPSSLYIDSGFDSLVVGLGELTFKIPNALSQHLIFPIQHGSFSLIEGSFIPTAPSGPEFTTNTTSTSNIRSMQIIGLTGPSGRSMARQGGSSASRRGKWRDYRKRRRAKIGLWSGTGLIDDGGSGR